MQSPTILGALAVSLWLSIGVAIALARRKITVGVPFKPRVFERSARPGAYWSLVTVYVCGALGPLIVAVILWVQSP
jgi:hypothetical protein